MNNFWSITSPQYSMDITDLFIAEFLSESCHEVPKLCRGDETVPIFVKMTKAFYKVFGRVSTSTRTNCLKEKLTDWTRAL